MTITKALQLVQAAHELLSAPEVVSAGLDGDVNYVIKKARMSLEEMSGYYYKLMNKETDPEAKKAYQAAMVYLDKVINMISPPNLERFTQNLIP